MVILLSCIPLALAKYLIDRRILLLMKAEIRKRIPGTTVADTSLPPPLLMNISWADQRTIIQRAHSITAAFTIYLGTWKLSTGRISLSANRLSKAIAFKPQIYFTTSIQVGLLVCLIIAAESGAPKENKGGISLFYLQAFQRREVNGTYDGKPDWCASLEQ